jgi:hypothetical protein
MKESYRKGVANHPDPPKDDGRQRPLGIAALEDKIVQAAGGRVLSPTWKEDLPGFSYGFRPGRGQHDASASSSAAATRCPSWAHRVAAGAHCCIRGALPAGGGGLPGSRPVTQHPRTDACWRSRALELLEQVGLHGRLQHLPGELSGGEKAASGYCEGAGDGANSLRPAGALRCAPRETKNALLRCSERGRFAAETLPSGRRRRFWTLELS